MIQRVICPKCNRTVRSINSFHYCKQVALDDLFINKPDEVLLVFDRLLEQVSALEDVEISGTKNCVVFVRNKTFLVIKPMTKCLEIKFYSEKFIFDDEDIYKCELCGSRYEVVIRIKNENELKQKHFEYFKNSYLIC